MKIKRISLIKIAAISFLLTIFWSASAYAQPNITSFSGTLSNGGTLIITGTEFGTKTTAAPLWWDDAESGTVAANYNSVIGSNVYATGSGQSNSFSQRYLKFESFENYGTRWASKPVGTTLNKTIAFFKWRWDPNFTFDTYTNNNKIFMWGDNWDGNAPNFAISNHNYENKFVFGNFASTDKYGSYFKAVPGQWYDIKIILNIDYSGSYGTNGTAQLYVDNVLMINGTGIQFAATNAPGIQEPHIGGWVGVASTECATGRPNDITYADNIYIDNTWARVEIGNAPTLAASTIREIQIPSVWSDSSITITVNQGSFSNLNNTYLYVIDADGNVNENGYLLSDGGGGNTPPPSSGSGSDNSASGGSGCGFVKDDNGKGPMANGGAATFAMMLIITLAGIDIARRVSNRFCS